jgi:hypothetical protein
MLRFENGWEVWIMSVENLWGASYSHNGEHIMHSNFTSYNRDEVVQHIRDAFNMIGSKEIGR